MNENLIKSLIRANPWWERGIGVPVDLVPKFERSQLKRIMDYEKLGRVIVIKGPRRTGKSSLMYQCISKLLLRGVRGEDIIFSSMDDLNLRVNIEEILTAHEQLKDNNRKKIYLFLDEIQFLPNWSLMVKNLVDRRRDLVVIVSGSSASLLAKSSESLAGRTIEETVLPFSFREVLAWRAEIKNDKKAKEWLEKCPKQNLVGLKFVPAAIAWQTYLQRQLTNYLKRGGWPHLFKVESEILWLDLMRTDIIQKAIYKDLADLYDVRDSLSLEKLFLYLIESTSGIVNTSSVAVQLKLSRETINQYISYLINSYLLLDLPKYSRYPKEILKSQSKIHAIDPGLVALVGGLDKSRLIESLMASLLVRNRGEKLYYWRENYEVDIVLELGNRLIPVEIKNSEKIFSASEYRGLINFIKKYKTRVDEGYIFYQGEYRELKVLDKLVKFIPIWYVAGVL